ncbi:MAG: sigma-54 dependent transcriptional regulator [Planctomycetota bacterium]|nr:sigma-54 dependent transcriptional regulator [Planctomycetota bacterium]
MKARILIVDDEAAIRNGLSQFLEDEGHEPTAVGDGQAALERIRDEVYDLVITDLKMPGMDGLSLLEKIHETNPLCQVAVLTGHGTIAVAVEAMKKGALEFIEKPFQLDRVRRVVRRALERQRLAEGQSLIKKELRVAGRSGDILGKSAAIRDVLALVEKVAPTPSTVLILGETGTGKELVARNIHDLSPRKERPFVAINCGALPDTLLESELFGHARGAFTGAETARKGLFEAADGGSLFLDELGNVSEAMQVKLLRVLEKGEMYRVGERKPMTVDVRIIAATNRDLKEAAAKGEFRQDLFYRLNVITISVPPLRDRRGDIPIIAGAFLERHRTELGKGGLEFGPEALEVLEGYDWPGNVRELENCVERAVILTDGQTITPEDLPEDLQAVGDSRPRPGTLSEMEKARVIETLRTTSGHQGKAAEILGISARTLRRMIIRYKIEK